VIEDLQAEFPEISRLQVRRPRVSSEQFVWAFVSAVGAGFIASGITDIVQDVLWPLLLPSTQPHPEWLTPFVITRAVELVAMAAVGLRGGGIATLVLCVGYELALIIAQLPGLMAICERVGPHPDPSFGIQCEPVSFAAATWPTWLGLAVGALASRRLLPPPTAGTNTLLRAAGAFTLTLTASFTTFGILQMTVLSGLAGDFRSDPPPPVAVSYQVSISTVSLFVELAAGLVAGALLRRAPPAAVLLFALLVFHGIDFGLTLIRSNVEHGVPHPPELAYLQSQTVLAPAAAILGIAVGRLLARRNRVLARM